MARDARVRVAVVNDYELVVEGVALLLSRFPDQLDVCDRVVIGEPIETPVDVALYDTYGRVGIAAHILRDLVATPGIGHVAVFSLEVGTDLISEGKAAGATGFISKALPGSEIADAITRVARGEEVVAFTSETEVGSEELDWPGRADGLTERQSQVLMLVAEGLSNREVATALFLSPETVKGYIAQVFAKLGFRNRVQATNYVRQSGAFSRYASTPRGDAI
jgi:DNA-binding NarL/FixJ family response regulator